MRRIIIQSLIFALIILGCSNNENSKSIESSAYKIDLSEQGVSASEPPMLSVLAENIEYIPLETSKVSLVKGNHQVYVSAKYIYTIAFRQILQFDRRDGTFIKELGQYGQGPDEYIATLPSVPSFDIDKPLVLTAKHIKVINAETNQLEIVANQMVGALSFARLDSETFVGFFSNFSCEQKDRLVVYNQDGVEIKRYPNHLTCQLDDKNTISFDLSEGQFYYNDSNVFFKEVYNDTIFKVGKEQLEAHAYFHLGDKGIPYSEKENLNERDKWDKVIVTNTFESDDYIFFSYSFKNKSFSGVFDKRNKVSYIPEKKSDQNGIQDDIHGFLDFKPLTIGNENEVVSYYYPQDILNWFEEREGNDKIPEPLKNLKALKDDDNPVVAILKLKEN